MARTFKEAILMRVVSVVASRILLSGSSSPACLMELCSGYWMPLTMLQDLQACMVYILRKHKPGPVQPE